MMDRLTGLGYRASIHAAMDLIPEPIRRLIDCDFLCGVDPVFAGLHDHELIGDGRSYRTTAHVVYEHNQIVPRDRRRTTVVLPTVQPPQVLVHELGHVLHGRLGWRHGWLRQVTPVSAYAKTNWCEAFAEAVTSWCVPGYAAHVDQATDDYLDRLLVGELR